MRSLGGLLFFLGAGSVVLHLLGREFLVLAPLTPYQPAAGILVAIIGAVLIFAGERSDRRLETETVTETRVDDAVDVERRTDTTTTVASPTTTTTTTTAATAVPPAHATTPGAAGYGTTVEASPGPGTAGTAAPDGPTVVTERTYDAPADAGIRTEPARDPRE